LFVIIGSTTADWFVFSNQPFNNLGGDGFTAGNLIFCDDPPRLLLGGNGGCSAYVSAGLGRKTALCSAVGQDDHGDKLFGWLQDRGVDLEASICSEKSATSNSTIIISGADHQSVFHHLGATRDIRLDLIPSKVLISAEILLATSYSLIPAMRSGSLLKPFTAVRKAGGINAIDIGPAIGEPVLLGELKSMLPLIDYLIANSHELSVLTQSEDWEESCRRLPEFGHTHIVIKRGANGASIRGPEIELDVPGFSVDANISVGAGDAFNAGFLCGVQQGWPLQRAVRFANGLAAMTVSSSRGVLDAPTLSQVEAFLAKED